MRLPLHSVVLVVLVASALYIAFILGYVLFLPLAQGCPVPDGFDFTNRTFFRIPASDHKQVTPDFLVTVYDPALPCDVSGYPRLIAPASVTIFTPTLDVEIVFVVAATGRVVITPATVSLRGASPSVSGGVQIHYENHSTTIPEQWSLQTGPGTTCIKQGLPPWLPDMVCTSDTDQPGTMRYCKGTQCQVTLRFTGALTITHD